MNIRTHIFRWSGYLLLATGTGTLLMVILALTRLPFDAHRHLGEANSGYDFTPDVILMLGGSGMPSEANLIRFWYVGEAAKRYPGAMVTVIHPADSGMALEMIAFLQQMDVDSSRVEVFIKGTNTREQAYELSRSRPSWLKRPVVVITSPEHMYRTIGVFRKAGFDRVGGIPAFEDPMFVSLDYDHRGIGGRRGVPDVSGHLALRYTFWNYIKLEIICLREYAAIFYYRLNGWI